MKEIIAITGGIGAGKSVVSHVLRALGYPVYDSDSRAKALMDSDAAIKERLAVEIAREVICGDAIDRAALARIVFADSVKLAKLNAIVHQAVRLDIAGWVSRQSASRVFVETAILYQSGLNRMVDAEWRVTAPEALRIERVMARNGLSADAVRARIESQRYEPAPDEPRPELHELLNDGVTPLLPRIEALLGA
ncbi:MAG: dephospho-CoA kinase [Muribaculaceae bacterium]|nr:dephospho-CoA kinase [Muribaculaceae bacterium]